MSRRAEPRIVNLETDRRQYVGLKVVAIYFGSDPRTVSAWIDEGKLPCYYFGKYPKIKLTDLRAFEQQARADNRSTKHVNHT